MGYSRELAARSRSSPWQCMDCKVCAICEDSKDGVRLTLIPFSLTVQNDANAQIIPAHAQESMLVCDMCDRGFHMDCHKPPVAAKPLGKLNLTNVEIV